MNFNEFRTKAQAGKEGKIKSSSIMYRWQRYLSIRISWLLIKVFPKIRANHVSLFNILFLLAIFLFSFFALKVGVIMTVFIQLILLNFTSVLDKIDGEIARHQEYFTQRGVYYDLVYHFFYTFVFYFVVGFYFFLNTANIFIWLPTLFLAIIATNHKMLGKLRHHVGYKVLLEHHGQIIKDFVPERVKPKRKARLWRVLGYLIFMMYDWTWTFYFLLIVLSYFHFSLAAFLFFVHVIVSIIMFLYQILSSFPKKGLYTRDELN
ncbi:CDP-alcohol phosphatidyltransferase family protein [Candidatus Parcubacteria bacterium]|mgnify:FL=1|jgi:hypothetical protein|nr:CDP-alcohol phosphatidyltransferase family protein [Candidatus Parcubacteria bacterium]